MVSANLEIPTLASAVNNLPALMDAQTDILDQALQGDIDFSVAAGGTIVIAKSDSLRNFCFNLTGSPGADFNLDFPMNNRYFVISNKSGKTATIRIDGGAGKTVIVFDTEKRVLYIDGTDVLDITGVGIPNEETLVTRATDFTISTTTLTAIDWNAETRDEGAWHDNSTDPEQIKMGQGRFDATAKIHIINVTVPDTIDFKIQRYNSSDALQETVAEDRRYLDTASTLDLTITLTVLNIRGIVGDYLTVEVKSVTDTGYSVEADDSYFLVRTSTSGGAGIPLIVSSDPDFSQVSLLVSFDGSDAATSATDDSNTGHTLTFDSNAQLDTAQKKFGSASLLLDGTDDHVSLADDLEHYFKFHDFTVELWVRFTTEPTSFVTLISKYDVTGGNRGWRIAYDQTNNEIQGGFSTTGSDSPECHFTLDVDGISVANFFNSQFHHIAFVRKARLFLIYVDGLVGNTAIDNSSRIFLNTTKTIIGASASGGGVNQNIAAHIDEVRITKGLARYTANFTPPTASFFKQ